MTQAKRIKPTTEQIIEAHRRIIEQSKQGNTSEETRRIIESHKQIIKDRK